MAEEMDDEKRAQKRAEILARRKEMERERRKAIRAAYARQREAKRKKPSPVSRWDFSFGKLSALKYFDSFFFLNHKSFITDFLNKTVE